jgi:hypothetical protein
MGYKNTNIPFLKKDCLLEFGKAIGLNIYNEAFERLSSMLRNVDYRNNKYIKMHITKNMFPIMAYYLTLLDNGFSKEEAYNLTLKETQKAAYILKNKITIFGKLPFAYRMFKLSVKNVISKMYPKEGWDIDWIKFDNKEIHINFNKCIYVEMTSQYGCPELCTVFCKNDPIVFSGYEPKICFERFGTIAEGADFCDFHFLNGSKENEGRN